MSKSENIRILAETAFDSKNFEQAYQYYSKLLEEDLSDSTLWIRKGLSAGWCSTPKSPKIDEMIVLIKKAVEEGAKDSKENLANQMLDVCDEFLSKLIKTIDEEVTVEFDRKPMATGEDIFIHQTAKLPIQLKYGNQYAPVFIKIRDAIQYACSLNFSANNYKRGVQIIDKYLQHSANNLNYFKSHKDAGDRQIQTEKIRSEIIGKLKEIEPNFVNTDIPQKSSGCFIATATLGTEYHPYIDTFRNFRDERLLNHHFGKVFVKYYYVHSPSVASVIEKSNFLRKLSLFLFISPVHKLILLLQKKRTNKSL